MYNAAKSEVQTLPFKRKGPGEWLQNSFKQNTEH